MAAILPLVINQGATFRVRFTWQDANETPINVTGYTARMQARETVESTSTRLSLTTENGGITLGGAAGTIDLYLSATATAAIDWESSVYDLEVINGAEVSRLIAGEIVCVKEVTR